MTCGNPLPGSSVKECAVDKNYIKNYEDVYTGLIEAAIYGILKRKHKKSDYKYFTLAEYDNGKIKHLKIFYKGVHKNTIETTYGNPTVVKLINV